LTRLKTGLRTMKIKELKRTLKINSRRSRKFAIPLSPSCTKNMVDKVVTLLTRKMSMKIFDLYNSLSIHFIH
jgi:hypothetical protein